MPNSNGKLYPSVFKPWSNIITRQNALTQRWEALPIDGNPAMGRLNHRWEGMTVGSHLRLILSLFKSQPPTQRWEAFTHRWDLTIQKSGFRDVFKFWTGSGTVPQYCVTLPWYRPPPMCHLYTNGGIVRGFIPGYIATRQVYRPTYGAEYTVSSHYYKYSEMNHVVEALVILSGGIHTMEGLFTLISWASEGLHSKPVGLLNIYDYFNNLIKFLDDAVRQNFMASNQRKLFISSFFVDELLDKLELLKLSRVLGLVTTSLQILGDWI
ncbi:hypothetical protein DM860_015576 [Cuscuta australis]|uniref:cytokinin riboside 5'-monophosphate phosphoribohydrolase n=1 Tax=Cuscuta australis TaxID=267555 RepID=A0A328EAA5_9ASTE|nr:hypothetical protein DM860_015576 [Cuscuta australis]